MSNVPLQNASDLTLSENPPNLPNVNSAMTNWFQAMTFEILVKTNVDFILVETPTAIEFQGVWQAFTDQQLMIKPEGQRKWRWFTCHADTTLDLSPDDVITYEGQNYRVMQKLDHSKYGFFEYHLCEDYQEAP